MHDDLIGFEFYPKANGYGLCRFTVFFCGTSRCILVNAYMRFLCVCFGECITVNKIMVGNSIFFTVGLQEENKLDQSKKNKDTAGCDNKRYNSDYIKGGVSKEGNGLRQSLPSTQIQYSCPIRQPRHTGSQAYWATIFLASVSINTLVF